MVVPGKTKWNVQSASSDVLHYGIALVSVAAALGLTRIFVHFDLPQPFTALALSAIAITFWYGGTGPGILATFFSMFVRGFFFAPEVNGPSRALYDLVFLVFALLMTQVARARNNLAVRVAERTAQLTRANDSLKVEIAERKQAEEAVRQAQAELAHVNRVTTLGELTASLAHEVNQPIAAAVTDANTCLRWLTRDHPDLEEARAAAARVVKDAARAAEIISQVRLLFKKSAPERQLIDVNDVIPNMIVLLRSEATRYEISVRAELAADLPRVIGDRVQLQQVIMNLVTNSVDAMKDVNGTRELVIRSQRTENEEVLVSVLDTGVGLPQQHANQIFNAFFTTKSHGTGLGLRISRSIVESHGGRLWAADNSPRGASFNFTLPAKLEAHEQEKGGK
jgi:C4-dicarboxylate-specific signal transduction histidine kinase